MEQFEALIEDLIPVRSDEQLEEVFKQAVGMHLCTPPGFASTPGGRDRAGVERREGQGVLARDQAEHTRGQAGEAAVVGEQPVLRASPQEHQPGDVHRELEGTGGMVLFSSVGQEP